ncbi:sodium-dependent transporter [Aquibacillus koreensis]|uniref:Sodium-dependent transporter n=1 Tax=Aquibacillus koreensis TaxID=279446 RepID=A0A9X4AI48_9BACI|nr:sodium-dependent transporter [Aquibacillus koreensis]MCT2535913.1 sodium-dependent transporter [Aquibacillus koreensis]MDC3420369.1 sodium-dependent transporter [Aquibacillus koreensis]
MENRSQWGTRLGFLLAAMGSAIGLGNIWRFPATAYENGGGAFFLPYLFALLTAGIPLLIMEYTIGHKFRGSAPRSYSKVSKGMEWIGWWQVAVSFIISTYYPVIIAWAIMYSYFSFGQSWENSESATAFFTGDYLNLSEPGVFGEFLPSVLLPLIAVWAIVLFVLGRGIKKGIEVANKIFIPLLAVIFLIIVVRAVTLEGALEGLDAFFAPDWSSLRDGSVWVAAYGQIFFSLSIAFAIMITYASYLPKKSDITNNAFITGFANSSFELLAGIGVFAALGFLASQNSQEVSEVVAGGIGLAFMVFPEIISQMPLSGLFGVLFFGSLVLAGLSSMISISETYIAGVQEKFNVSRGKAIAFGGGLAAVISLAFANQGGLFLLDTVDHFINSYGVALAGLFEVVAIAWFAKELKNLQKHADSVSDIKLGVWWRVCLSFITPVVLGYMMIQNLRAEIIGTVNDEGTRVFYEGYPIDFLFNFGWVVAIAAMFAGALFTLKKWPKNTAEAKANESEDEEVAQ